MRATDDEPPDPGPRQRAGTKPRPHTVTELRVALVCYGGVSLAVYMHGITKELHKLVVASRRFDDLGPAAENPFDPVTETEHAYFETLGDMARNHHLVSVSIDIIAGTSAGGINGVCLSKVLARNGSQETLKRLWIDQGDLSTLLRSPPIGGWRTRAALSVAGTVARIDRPTSPLRGERMSRLLFDAIEAMDASVDPGRRSLLLPVTPLELVVTTTDLDGVQVLVADGAGSTSQRETDHSRVLRFVSTGADFDAAATGALAFAGRATSSFPGAFAPISPTSFRRELAGRPVDLPDLFSRLNGGTECEPTTLSSADHDRETGPWFVDGGVLDNAPFDLAIAAIGAKRAQNEVVRRLVYIQPDPGGPLSTTSSAGDRAGHGAGAADHGSGRAPATPAPGYLSALWRAVGGVRSTHSIMRDLVQLRDLNLRIVEAGAIATLQMTQVWRAIDAAWSAAVEHRHHDGSSSPRDAWSIDDPADIRRLSDAMYSSTPQLAGAGFSTYCRLKVIAAGDRLADELVTRLGYAPGTGQESFVRAAVGAWARQHVEWSDPDPTRLMELLGPVDVPYRERRLLFVLAGVSDLYSSVGQEGGPRRADLDALKVTAWHLLDALRTAPRAVVAAVPDAVIEFAGGGLTPDATNGSAELFARLHDQEFGRLFATYRDGLAQALGDSTGPLWQRFVESTQHWGEPHRRGLIARYLGFPLWDAMIFPTVAFTQIPQFTPIGTMQFSPLAATALPTPAGGKLKGVTLHHFGGFVDASWRENDYLWGRLDGCELVLRLLGSISSSPTPLPTPDSSSEGPAPRGGVPTVSEVGRHLRTALDAILHDEADLRRITLLRDTLASQVAALP